VAVLEHQQTMLVVTQEDLVEMVVAETDLQLLVDLQHNLDNLEFLDHLV
jgi:hypothetical protein